MKKIIITVLTTVSLSLLFLTSCGPAPSNGILPVGAEPHDSQFVFRATGVEAAASAVR